MRVNYIMAHACRLLFVFMFLCSSGCLAGFALNVGAKYDRIGQYQGSYTSLSYVTGLTGGDNLSKKHVVYPLHFASKDADAAGIGIGRVFAGGGKLTPILRTRRWSKSLQSDFSYSDAYYAYYSGGVSFVGSEYGAYIETAVLGQLYKYLWAGLEARYIGGIPYDKSGTPPPQDPNGYKLGFRFAIRAPAAVLFDGPTHHPIEILELLR